MAWYDDDEDALDLDWDSGSSFSFPSFDSFSLPSFGSFELPSLDSISLPSFDSISLPSFDSISLPSFDSLNLPTIDTSGIASLGNDFLGSLSNFGSDIYKNVSDVGSDIYGGITDLFGDTSYADMEDADAGRYLDEQYAADVLEGLDQQDMDAGMFLQEAQDQAATDAAINFADQQDTDAANYLNELINMETIGGAADQEDIDRAMYQQEQIDESNAAIDFADQEDIDREMYRQEQQDLGITREGAASGKFTDLSGKDTTKITKEEITKDDKKVTDKDTKTTPGKDILKTLSDNKALLALLGGLLGLMSSKGGGATPGYKGGIPTYTATRGTPVSPTAGGRRAGGAGLGSLTGGVTYTKAAQGGLMDVMAGQPNENVLMMAQGGLTGRYLRGATGGMADKIYTDIDGKQPARLSHGEFVIPADVVSHLGNGNSDAGAKELHEMMNRVRKARTGTTKQGKEIKPRKYMAA